MKLRFLWILIFIGMTLIVSLFTFLSPSPVFAQVLQANCTNYLICDAGFTNCQTPAGHGPLFQGRTYDFKITMKNVGDTTWFPTVTSVNPGGPFKFGAACPNDKTTWGKGACDGDGNATDSSQGNRLNRVDLTREVLPNDSYEFSLSATTPASAGTDYLMVYRMVQDGVAWFGAACVPSLQVDNTLAQPPSTPAPTPAGDCLSQGFQPGGKKYQCGFGADSCNTNACVGVPFVCNADGSWSNANPLGECTTECTDCRTGGGTSFNVGPAAAGIAQIELLFINIVFAAVGLGFIVMFVWLVWAGFKYLTSGGEPKAIQSAHQTLTWALLGVIFLAVAWLVLQLIAVFTGINVTFFNLRTLF